MVANPEPFKGVTHEKNQMVAFFSTTPVRRFCGVLQLALPHSL